MTKIDGNDQQNFAVTSTGFDNSTFTVRARKVVLATGLKDDLPETPGIWENWGKGMYWVCFFPPCSTSHKTAHLIASKTY